MKIIATADGRDMKSCKLWIDPLFEIQDEIRKQAIRCELPEAPTLKAIRERRQQCK